MNCVVRQEPVSAEEIKRELAEAEAKVLHAFWPACSFCSVEELCGFCFVVQAFFLCSVPGAAKKNCIHWCAGLFCALSLIVRMI